MATQTSDSTPKKKKRVVDYLTRQEAADYLRISTRTLDNLTKEGAIPHYKLGANNSRVLFKYEDLANYVENYRIEV